MLCAHALILFNKFSCFCNFSEIHRTIVKFVYVSNVYMQEYTLCVYMLQCLNVIYSMFLCVNFFNL